MVTEKVWKTFIPHEVFSQPSSHLFGKINWEKHTVFITASAQTISTTNWLAKHLSLVGTWDDIPSTVVSKGRDQHNFWIKLSYNTANVLDCKFFRNSEPTKCTVVIYDAGLLLKSALLQERCNNEGEDNLTLVYSALQSTRQILCDLEIRDGVKVFTGNTDPLTTIQGKLFRLMYLLVYILYFPFLWIRSDNRQGNESLVQKICTTPTTMNQLGRRIKDLRHIFSTTSCRNYSMLRDIDSCCRQIVDTVLGVLLMYWLMQGNTAQAIADTVLTYADAVSNELKTLLHWLMGAPAGLKLNSPLTHLLAQFFQYHIYLWIGYLYLLKPVLGFMVYYSSSAGLWGLTVQLSLYQDIFSTLTLHIYCFYVYAARLYRLQLYALASFWRLFRGKKWNVLRQRVDSAVYDADQLFLGTLLFTVLLFLLPTTLIYYVVFTLLRLLVLMIQHVIGKIRHFLNTIPVWSIWLWASRSPLLTDGAKFHIWNAGLCEEDNSCFIISMQLNRIALTEVIALTRNKTSSTNTHSWSTLCKNLLYGDLVFPWIQKKPVKT